MALAPILPYLYRILQPTFPDCLWSGSSATRSIALTFDDGPHCAYTPQLLRVLDRYQVTASFFWLGLCVERAPAVAKAVWQQGHWIGLHGYDHRAFPRLPVPQLKQSLEQTQAAIAHACGRDWDEVRQTVRDVRPPNSLFTPQTLKVLRQWGYRPVMWSVVPEDWVSPGIPLVIDRVLSQTRNGSHIVLHDGCCGGENVAEIADRLIPRLLAQGYQFVTIDQLWQQHPLRSGDRLGALA